jgi:pSer/pThr/pTyr-binding forkhead associated (FHA) protein
MGAMADESSKLNEPTVAGGAPIYVVQRRARPLFIRQVKGPGAPRDTRLELDEIIIGRGQDAHVCIESGAVSRRHAALIRSDDQYICVDLNSSNGVYVNGQRVTRMELRDSDTVQVGDALFVFQRAP